MSEEGDIDNLLVKDLGLALSPKCVPTNHRPSKRSIIVRHLAYEKKWPMFIWTSRLQVLQGMFVKRFATMFEGLTA